MSRIAGSLKVALATALIVAGTAASASTMKPEAAAQPIVVEASTERDSQASGQGVMSYDAFRSAKSFDLVAGTISTGPAVAVAPYGVLKPLDTAAAAPWKTDATNVALATSCQTKWYWMSLIEFITCQLK